MKIVVTREQFQDILEGLNNALIATEEWDPDKGMLFIECEEDIIVADVLECTREGQGRWLVIFHALLPGKQPPCMPVNPISGALREVPKISEKPKRQSRNMREFLNSMTKPWHGYYEE
jgi:hypothetical protein